MNARAPVMQTITKRLPAVFPHFQLILASVMLSLFFAVSAAQAQIVYVAEKGEQSYVLVGTIHLGSGPSTRLSNEVLEAMLTADAVYFELSMRELQSGAFTMIQAGRRHDGTLAAALGPDLWEEFSAFAELYGLPRAQINQLEMWLIHTFLTAQIAESLGFRAAFGIEAQLYALLEEHHMTENGLERINDQILALQALFRQDDEKTQARRLMREADNLAHELAQMEALWQAGQLDALMSMIYREQNVEALEALLEVRNLAWFSYLQSRYVDTTEPTRLFIAVGAGHLGGPTGLIAQFKSLGFQVTPWTAQ